MFWTPFNEKWTHWFFILSESDQELYIAFLNNTERWSLILINNAIAFENCKQQLFTLTMCLPACLWAQITRGLTIRGLTIRGSYDQGLLQSGVLTIRGSYNQGFLRSGVLQPGVPRIRGSYNLGFKSTCLTWRVCAQMLILIVKSYDQGCVLIANSHIQCVSSAQMLKLTLRGHIHIKPVLWCLLRS